jgi:hypothetical protein
MLKGLSLWVPHKADAMDVVSGLQTPTVPPRRWHHGGRLQDCFRAAAQTLGEVVDDRGGQVILDRRVIWLSQVWAKVHQRYVPAQPMPVIQGERAKGAQYERKAA